MEDNAAWADFIKNKHLSNADVKYISNKLDYVTEISKHEKGFDVIVIDGEHSRFKCAQVALSKLIPGGMVILDNSDHYFRTAQELRGSNLIQVDMSGFGPILGRTWTTSLFLHRDFSITPIGNIQPLPPIGSSPSSEEERTLHEGGC